MTTSQTAGSYRRVFVRLLQERVTRFKMTRVLPMTFAAHWMDLLHPQPEGRKEPRSLYLKRFSYLE